MVNVLIVEDDTITARWLRRTLLDSPHEKFAVVTAETFAAAAKAIASHAFDLVILDLNLPDSEADETFDRFRHYAPQLPVIVATAIDDEEIAVTLLRRGALDYLTKPFQDAAMFQMMVHFALRRMQLLRELTILSDIQRKPDRLAHQMPDSPDTATQTLFAAQLVSIAFPHLWRRNYAQAREAMQQLENILADMIMQTQSAPRDDTQPIQN